MAKKGRGLSKAEKIAIPIIIVIAVWAVYSVLTPAHVNQSFEFDKHISISVRRSARFHLTSGWPQRPDRSNGNSVIISRKSRATGVHGAMVRTLPTHGPGVRWSIRSIWERKRAIPFRSRALEWSNCKRRGHVHLAGGIWVRVWGTELDLRLRLFRNDIQRVRR